MWVQNSHPLHQRRYCTPDSSNIFYLFPKIAKSAAKIDGASFIINVSSNYLFSSI